MLQLETAEEIIRSAARSIARDDHSVEPGDLFQASYLKYFEHKHKVMGEDEGGHPKTFLWKLVRNVAHDMRAQNLRASCQYTYRSSDVRMWLEIAYNESAKVKGTADASRNDTSAIRSDIQTCLNMLDDTDRKIIFSRYGLLEIPPSGTAERKRLDRAVRRLTFKMNSFRGLEPMRRNAISNANARFILLAQETE